MKMKYSKILFAFIVCSIFGCEKFYPIELKNESNKSIGYYFALGGKFGSVYPDSLPKGNEYVEKNLLPNMTYYYYSRTPWETIFADKSLLKDTLSIYIFSSDTLNTYSWQRIRQEEKYLKRYDLSLNDLNDLSFKIVFK